MGIGRFGAYQEIRELKEKNKQRYEEPPSFTDEEIEVLKHFKQECEEKGIDSERLIEKLSKA